jgi:predicted GH43/DUF377 family glycosyl hydrolase
MLLLTIIILTLIVIILYVTSNNVTPTILLSDDPINITAHDNVSRSMSLFNLSARKDENGFSGLIRGVQGSRPSYSYPYRIFLDEDGTINKLERIELNYNNLKACTYNYRGVYANGIEDPRLFIFKGEEWVIANCLGSSSQPHPCVNAMCLFKLSSPQETFRILSPPDGVNPLQPQKNWAPFEWDGRLLCEYTLDPHDILEIDINTGLTEKIFTGGTNNIDISKGHSLRGGAPPILIGDIYIGIGHTRGPGNPDYYHFFYTFEAQPPFTIIKISKHFKLETSNLIQFVAGLSLYENKIYISYGVSDRTNRISCYNIDEIIDFINDQDKELSV